MTADAGDLRHGVALEAPGPVVRNALGEDLPVDHAERFRTRARLIYQAGGEDVQASRYAGREVFKLELRATAATRSIRTDWRLRMLSDGTLWDIREADTRSQAAAVFLVIEGPRAGSGDV